MLDRLGLHPVILRFITATLCLAASLSLAAQNVISIDATAPAPTPQPVAAHLGSDTSPNGDVLGVNSQYLTMNGHAWIPVMGEFHFSRYPQAEWEQEILKMKASGVNIISTYVIWIHHEQKEGVFDWSGQRDLRLFTELCGKHGMYVYPRIGPWAHAEVRNGGLPDWVLKNGPTRQDDPVYLKEVGTFYAQIAAQLKGELWKDGGPVIGLQIENEYRATGQGKGAEHIRTLKQMAVQDGLDVPLYTVTGWDGAAIPLDSVLPVFGGYPDAPWDGSPKKLPPNEVYAFRFDNRAAGSMGAIGGRGQNAASTYQGTPFLTAEVGDGIEDTYFRRPVLSADDIAAIAPVMLGSGVNLLGYYMFHGGRNPEGGDITLQESQRTGYPTDVPEKSYDFQAPLGEFGQERESLRKLKLVHYFLGDFGETLAPMIPHAPAALPASPSDITVPRVAARTKGDAGFIFFNNHVRAATEPLYAGFQVNLKLPSGEVHVPNKPISLPSGAYGIWPVNMKLGDDTLIYSTAQLFKHIASKGQTFYFFFSIPGLPAEFALASSVQLEHASPNLKTTRTKDLLTLRASAEGDAEVQLHGGITLVLLTEPHAEQVWRGDDPAILLSTASDVFSDGPHWTLQSTGEPKISFGIFGATSKPTVDGKSVAVADSDSAADLFTSYIASVPPIHVQANITARQLPAARSPWQYGPVLSWRKNPVPLAPDDNDFAKAAVWTVSLPALPATPNLSDAYLRIRYEGDAARLYRQDVDRDTLVDDNFWNGQPWEIGLRETEPAWPPAKTSFRLRILPLPKEFPMYIENAERLIFSGGSVARLTSAEVVPQYQVVVDLPSHQ